MDSTSLEPPRPRRTQRERRAESSRRLLDAAAELIAEKGVEQTTAAEIGLRAGYSRSMVRARYGSKDALLETLLGGEYRALLEVRPDPAVAGLDRAVAHIGRTRDVAGSDPTLLRAFYVVCFESTGPRPGLRQWTQDWIGQYQDSLARALADGITDGSVDASIDPAPAAAQTLTYGLGLAFRWLVDDGTDFVAALRESEDRYRETWRARR